MKEEDVDELVAAEGGYCWKERSGCFCRVGYPYECQCTRCRDTRPKDQDQDWCHQGGFCWTPAEIDALMAERNAKRDAAIERHWESTLLVPE